MNLHGVSHQNLNLARLPIPPYPLNEFILSSVTEKVNSDVRLDNSRAAQSPSVQKLPRVKPLYWRLENSSLDGTVILQKTAENPSRTRFLENSSSEYAVIVQNLRKRLHAKKILASQPLHRAGIVQSPPERKKVPTIIETDDCGVHISHSLPYCSSTSFAEPYIPASLPSVANTNFAPRQPRKVYLR